MDIESTMSNNIHIIPVNIGVSLQSSSVPQPHGAVIRAGPEETSLTRQTYQLVHACSEKRDIIIVMMIYNYTRCILLGFFIGNLFLTQHRQRSRYFPSRKAGKISPHLSPSLYLSPSSLPLSLSLCLSLFVSVFLSFRLSLFLLLSLAS